MMFAERALKIRRYNVLIVDDQSGIRTLVATLLTKIGHLCAEATDGVDALERALANKFDAVITDIVMPRMNGIVLTKELLKQTPNLPVMVMTGHGNEFSSVTAVSAGAKEFISKPFSLGEFTLRFQKMMRDHELLIQLQEREQRMSFDSQWQSEEDINELKKEIETLRNRLHAGYPRFSQ